jgi:hypothetical protein
LVHYRFHPDTKSYGVWSKERRYEKLCIVEGLFKIPEAQKYLLRKREAMATAHRYAADCSWMSRDKCGFLFHLMMDILWLPTKGWDRRRALFYYLRERKKGLKMGAQG